VKRNLYLILVVASFFILSCGGRPNPRKIAMEFIEAVYASDSSAILKYVDFEEVARDKMKHLPEDMQLGNLDLLKDLFRSLVRNGSIRAKWESYRIVVAGETVREDSAWVDVTFMHKKTGSTRYTQMILLWKDNSWKIASYVE
jgi:hypothetical protein